VPAWRKDRSGDALEYDDPKRIQRAKEWQRKLYHAGYVAMGWPKEFGGQGADVMKQTIVNEELVRANAPTLIGMMGIQMVGPTLIMHGTDEQKRQYLPKILTADELWCQGYSEPGSGSDLASLKTRAALEGDHFVVNGQKIWTSGAQYADRMFCLVRTDPDAPKHRGISYVLIDMKSPGITVRPLRQITGEADFNEVFFENVRVPRENLLGELHEGWQIAVAALQNERGILYVVSMQIALKQARDKLLAFARERGAGRDPLLRQELAAVHLGAEIFRVTCQRTLDKLLRMGMPGPEASIIKLHWTELTQAMPRIGMQILGPEGLLYETPRPGEDAVHARPEQWLQRGHLGAPAASIASGTSEIMLGIIAMQVLGLPRGG